MKVVIAIASIAAVVGLIFAAFLFKKGQSIEPALANARMENIKLGDELTDIKTKNTELDKELFSLKNTELAKEIELLRLKLNDQEKEFAASQKETSDLMERSAAITANIERVQTYLDVIDEINKVYLGKPPPPQWDLGGIVVKVAAVNDAELTSFWKTTKDSTDIIPGDWLPDQVGRVIVRATSKIYSLLR